MNDFLAKEYVYINYPFIEFYVLFKNVISYKKLKNWIVTHGKRL